MRIFSKRISRSALSLLVLFIFSGVPLPGADEGLIPPTRGLEGAEPSPGRLTVVSEPPGFEVFLDRARIGQTPVWLKPVEPGPHTLSIKQAETEIFVEPGKTIRISFFKGSFVAVSEEREADKQPEGDQQPKGLKAGRKVILPSAGERMEDLTPWERFLNRSSPNF